MTEQAKHSWSVAEAKARFSELIAAAHDRGPQVVTRHGRPVAVLLSPAEFEQAEAAMPPSDGDTLGDWLFAPDIRGEPLDTTGFRKGGLRDPFAGR